jgi:aminoglycoside 2'-N-acetyltransferase I
VAELRVAHTADLGPQELEAVRALLDGAFTGEDSFAEEDHEHALGGMHALVWEGPALVAHGAVVMRRLLHAGRALRTGYVEGVAVRADRRGRGHGAAVMAELERVVRGAYDLGALSATSEATAFYVARGWLPWTGTLSVVAPGGMRRTPQDEGSVHVLPARAAQDPGGDLACDWRDGEVW